MRAVVISVLAIAALIAFAAPRGEDPVPRDRAARLSAEAKHGQTQPTWYGGAMVLDREGDGHFYATVRVDTDDYRMLVDTGATVVALTGEDARNMGLDWDPNALQPVAQGASGPVMGVNTSIPEMSVGDFEVHDVQAVIVPDGLGISLLGQSFLEHVPKVDIADDTLTLSGGAN